RWLADVAPQLLASSLGRAIAVAKQEAAQRRAMEGAMPAGLRFVKGRPPRLPTLAEAGAIAEVRGPLLRRHGLANLYPDAGAVRR
ncbi:hypothetical protein ACJENL_27375, partial [Escherichia coli]